MHIHDVRVSPADQRGRFLGLMVTKLGGSQGDETGAEGGDGRVLGMAFRNLNTLHGHVQNKLPEGAVVDHDVAIVQTLIDEFRTHLPGGGGVAAAVVAVAASAAAAAAAAPGAAAAAAVAAN